MVSSCFHTGKALALRFRLHAHAWWQAAAWYGPLTSLLGVVLYPWRSHPPTWLRVRAAKELLPAAMEEYHVHKQQGRVAAATLQQRRDRTA